MAASPVTIYPAAASSVAKSGVPVTIMFGPVLGGVIVNPVLALDQGITVPEVLYVDTTGAPAAAQETATTEAIQPGGAFIIPPNQTTDVSVNAKSAGHKFSALIYQPATQFPPTPQTGTFPPSGPTTLTALGGMAAYLYQQYQDDDNLQAFITSFNQLAQIYIGWFATINLAVYTNPQIAGPLLDWVAEGIYGMTRPALGSGRNLDIGPLNTYAYNTLAYNRRKLIGPSDVVATSDDVFKRIMTWNFYKGDGNVFNVRWLKRRIMRFLIGENGTAPNIDETYAISVTIGPGIISIQIAVGTRAITGGALYNRFGFNRMPYNALRTRFIPGPPQFALAPVFEEAVAAGALQFPFQYAVSVSI